MICREHTFFEVKKDALNDFFYTCTPVPPKKNEERKKADCLYIFIKLNHLFVRQTDNKTLHVTTTVIIILLCKIVPEFYNNYTVS